MSKLRKRELKNRLDNLELDEVCLACLDLIKSKVQCKKCGVKALKEIK